LQSSEQLEWKEAMRRDRDDEKERDVRTHGTTQKIARPLGVNPCREVDEQSRASRYKARLVALRCSQISGVDFTETLGPVVRLESVRAALAIAAVEDLEIIQMDIHGAYLNGELKEGKFMRQPPGFEDETVFGDCRRQSMD
jgi:hypothetical protein